MVDATPSATPMPAQPVAAVTSLEAPFPPADPLLPVLVPPSVTDPVSHLDSLPVDDAFALEMRAETIEQLAGGDALRRGASERIEAGRSQTNADRVAGRDRVRVHGSLHEHTGHALAEQAAHLHTTVDGALDVHAASEDTVLLAGHMRELWDGGGAIVAAMTDDTVAGGGIRVTTPLDLWVHGLMGVEERIGTCAADAVLMELGLLGGADRPPQSAAQESDFHAAFRRLRELKQHYTKLSRAEIARDFHRAIDRVSKRIAALFKSISGNLGELPVRPSGITRADQAYLALEEMARLADRNGDLARAGAIRDALNAMDKHTVETLQALCTEHGIAEAPSTQVIQRPPMTAGPTATGAAIPPPTRTPMQFDWATAYRQLRSLSHYSSDAGWKVASADFCRGAERISKQVLRNFRKVGGDSRLLPPPSNSVTMTEWAYRAIEEMSRRATVSDEAMRAFEIRRTLEYINRITSEEVDGLTTRYGALDTLSIHGVRAMQRPPPRVGPTTPAALPVTGRPPATVPPTTAPPPIRLDVPVPAQPIPPAANPAFPEPAGGLIHATGVPGPPPACGLPGPSLAEATGAEAGDLGRSRLDPAATASGTTAAEPAATEATVRPSLGGASSFWLQPVDPVPAPGTVAFDSGLHRAGETVQPPPVTATAITTVSAPVAVLPTPSWLDDDFAVERALIAGLLPPGFDASRIVEAGLFDELGLADELAAGRLPIQAIDGLIEGFRATDEGGGNALFIEYLAFLKESIERALRAAYPGRVDAQWLDFVEWMLRGRGELDAPGAASATDLAEFAVTVIGRFLGTGEGVPHPAPSSSRTRNARRLPGSTQSSRFGPAAPGRSAGPPRGGGRRSTTSTGSTPSSSRPPRPLPTSPTSTGAPSRR